ncbi:MAG: DUF1847 domain-containing protein [Candidatus Abyssobacteria bacterium SURF_5]|uniref:DUF1847 domain-containing protein n=1 Tax=Abyssobacteria bacterium (strain SURF_5) TaxID=2093360 RepID=A0A3A4NFZ4_ABYX5|nr:MAG: DUF1847 domain-containing protein [Candidatus Abyssubacteria bacterium SURF_5]
MEQMTPQCAECLSKLCVLGPSENGPEFCVMRTTPELFDEARAIVANPDIQKMFRGVARTWKDSKLSKNRIEEIVIYARNMGFKKLGLAFCLGLSGEAEVVSALFKKAGFDVVSGCCMTGGFSSDDVGLPKEDKIYTDGRQPQCNPVGQALMMNKYGTQLNVMLGLCVGDDALFIKHSLAPITILAVKDRIHAHNPLAAIPKYKEELGL